MTLLRSNAAGSTGLHVRYEKAGLILDALPIPWNADAVIVEANVRLPKGAAAAKADFTLRLSETGPTSCAELIATQGKEKLIRVFFRVPTSEQSCVATVHWREHLLGQVEMPMFTQAAFDASFAVEMPSLHVVLGDRTVACRSFVATQAKSVLASAVIRSACPLATAFTIGLHVDLCKHDGNVIGSVPVPFTAAQQHLRETLVTVQLLKPRSIGAYDVTWRLANRRLHQQRINIVSRQKLLRSLRISATRFHVTYEDGKSQTLRSLPMRDASLALDGIAELTPIFLVSSGERGMAGSVTFTLNAVSDHQPVMAGEDSLVVTDGPTPIVLGVFKAASLPHIQHFSLSVGNQVLGNLPLVPAPQAAFSAEGGFAPMDDYLWSPAAEEQLNSRLSNLLGES